MSVNSKERLTMTQGHFRAQLKYAWNGGLAAGFIGTLVPAGIFFFIKDLFF